MDLRKFLASNRLIWTRKLLSNSNITLLKLSVSISILEPTEIVFLEIPNSSRGYNTLGYWPPLRIIHQYDSFVPEVPEAGKLEDIYI